jgi:hypothetical protein
MGKGFGGRNRAKVPQGVGVTTGITVKECKGSVKECNDTWRVSLAEHLAILLVAKDGGCFS